MSILSKSDFKTKQQWLKQQRRDLMKKESQKFHQFNSKHQKPNKIAVQNTLSHLLTSETDTLSQQSYSSVKLAQAFRNDSDAELYKQMSQRLLHEQEQMVKQSQKIKNLQSRIQQLKTQNALMKGIKSAANEILGQKQKIQQENAKLNRLFADMQKYLNDNGVCWSDDRLVGELQVGKIKKEIKEAKLNYKTPNQFQFQTILMRIGELNQALMNEFGERKYVNCQGVYRLANIQQVLLCFYRNGVMIESNFCQYDTKQGMRTMQDLIEGYYPHTLKTTYPQGAIMKVVSNLNQLYQESGKVVSGVDSVEWFKGKGHSLMSYDNND